ncbi:hypothetical protein T439DRAFT_333967 [Meredithblackwellia eburnea MCA 4105]
MTSIPICPPGQEFPRPPPTADEFEALQEGETYLMAPDGEWVRYLHFHVNKGPGAKGCQYYPYSYVMCKSGRPAAYKTCMLCHYDTVNHLIRGSRDGGINFEPPRATPAATTQSHPSQPAVLPPLPNLQNRPLPPDVFLNNNKSFFAASHSASGAGGSPNPHNTHNSAAGDPSTHERFSLGQESGVATKAWERARLRAARQASSKWWDRAPAPLHEGCFNFVLDALISALQLSIFGFI